MERLHVSAAVTARAKIQRKRHFMIMVLGYIYTTPCSSWGPCANSKEAELGPADQAGPRGGGDAERWLSCALVPALGRLPGVSALGERRLGAFLLQTPAFLWPKHHGAHTQRFPPHHIQPGQPVQRCFEHPRATAS